MIGRGAEGRRQQQRGTLSLSLSLSDSGLPCSPMILEAIWNRVIMICIRRLEKVLLVIKIILIMVLYGVR